jgi:hypothetical protein
LVGLVAAFGDGDGDGDPGPCGRIPKMLLITD